MTNTAQETWLEANQRYLMAALGVVRETLQRHADAAAEDGASADPGDESPARLRLREAAERMPDPPALVTLCRTFSLTDFERDVLLLSAAVELDGSFASFFAAAQGDPRKTRPCFSMALAAFPGAHWSALAPGSPLRRWRLIHAGAEDGLASGALHIDEGVLHYLAGLLDLDPRLAGFVRGVPRGESELVPSHLEVAAAAAGLWAGTEGRTAVVQLTGREGPAKRQLAAEAAARVRLRLFVMPAHVLPAAAEEMETLTRLWEREAALGRSALLLDCEALTTEDAAREALVAHFLEVTGGALMVAGRERLRLRHRPTVSFDVERPTADEQRELWRAALGADGAAENGSVGRLVSQFDLSAPAIQAAARQALGPSDRAPGSTLEQRLWSACRSQARPRIGSLAQRIRPVATWDDLVLPEPQLATLREAVLQVRFRDTVYERWGFAARSSRGLGISALFSGASGTGKTMAAEVLANELDLDLFLIDLSRVVSKYIGETEKNLARVFDVAEEGGAILFFDEADALFGKRSEVKDSHDRYANIEVSYLLQRMESYRGLAILTTNMKEALDDAFARRIRFMVKFPFPDLEHRARIWSRIFPASTPTEGLDPGKLAQLNVPGGNIRNIAMAAAFLAADDGQPVRMAHLLRAARSEYAKLEKPLTGPEIRGWA